MTPMSWKFAPQAQNEPLFGWGILEGSRFMAWGWLPVRIVLPSI